MSIDILNLNQYYMQLLPTVVSISIVDLEWREKDTLQQSHKKKFQTVNLKFLTHCSDHNTLVL